MSDLLEERLNQILPRITSEAFLRGSGLGNDVPFHIFDYPAASELRVREHLSFLVGHLARTRPELRVAHVNLFEMLVGALEARGFLARAFEKQRNEGDQALMKTLAPMFESTKLSTAFAGAVKATETDLILVSGVGSAYPVVRTHNLLSALQPKLGSTPLVLFYPGAYDGKYVRLFGKLRGPYYRAFKLIP